MTDQGRGTVRVLYVGPDAAATSEVEAELARGGVDVTCTDGAREARAVLADGPVDCVVSDHRPPAVDAARLSAAVDGDVPIVLYTETPWDDVPVASFEAGIDDYVNRDAGGPAVLGRRVVALANCRRRTRRRTDTEHRRLTALFENTADCVVDTDLDGATATIRRANRAFADLFDRDPAALVGEDLDDLVASAETYDDARDINRRVTAGERIQTEVTRQTADGPRRFLLRSIRTSDGDEDARAYFIYTDVTDRKHREDTLKALNDATQEMTVAKTTAETAAAVVETARAVIGAPRTVVFVARGDDLEPFQMRGTTDVPTFPVGEGLVGEAYHDGTVSAYDDAPTAEGATDRLHSVRSLVLVPLDDHGVLAIGSVDPGAFDEHTVEFAKLLGANAAAAFDRADRERQLRRQNERLDEFASIVSHDLRNPLNVARGTLDLVEADADVSGLGEVDAALARMEGLVERVLALARQGQFVEDPEPLDLRLVAELAWGTVDTGDATVSFETCPHVMADFERLQALFENLFRNAVEHGAGGDGSRSDDGPASSASIRVGTCDGGFYVEDDGPGIPEDEYETVFEHGYTTAADGTGFGLAIVENVVAAHDWEIRVEESDTGGARFVVTGVDVA